MASSSSSSGCRDRKGPREILGLLGSFGAVWVKVCLHYYHYYAPAALKRQNVVTPLRDHQGMFKLGAGLFIGSDHRPAILQ